MQFTPVIVTIVLPVLAPPHVCDAVGHHQNDEQRETELHLSILVRQYEMIGHIVGCTLSDVAVKPRLTSPFPVRRIEDIDPGPRTQSAEETCAWAGFTTIPT